VTVRQKDITVGAFTAVFFSYVYFVIIPKEVPVLSPVNVLALRPDFWPRVISICLIVLGLIQIAYAIFRRYPHEQAHWYNRKQMIDSILMALLYIGYLVGIPYLGILMTSILSLCICMIMFGERRIHYLILFSVLLPLGMHLFLTKVANVLIPQGILPI